jgi:hypothetical protein
MLTQFGSSLKFHMVQVFWSFGPIGGCRADNKNEFDVPNKCFRNPEICDKFLSNTQLTWMFRKLFELPFSPPYLNGLKAKFKIV